MSKIKTSSFSQRLQELLDIKNITQTELSQLTGITKSSISDWINNKYEAKQDKVDIIATSLNISPSWLMGYDVSINKNNYIINSPSLEKIPGITVLNKAKKIPILGTIACGSPIWADENYEGYFIADETIKADFILKAKGDSMIDAEIYDGDLVFMKKTPIVDSGKIAAVLLDGEEATLKKVVKTDDVYILQPCNISYDPIVIKEDTEALILGEAVGVYHAIKE